MKYAKSLKANVLGLFFMLSLPAAAQFGTAFKLGETVSYNISYNWGFIWLDAGWVTFTVTDTLFQGEKRLHFRGVGATYPKYDWIYEVRDYYHSITNQKLEPLYFERNVREGSTRIHHEYYFDKKNEKVYCELGYQEQPKLLDTLALTNGLVDLMTLIYTSRSIDLNALKIDEKKEVKFILDGKVYSSYIRYLGKEVFHSREHGSINCHKFRPLLVEGTIFKGGEDMTVWVSDDAMKIPIHVETPILIGWIKAYLTDYSGLVAPLKFSSP